MVRLTPSMARVLVGSALVLAPLFARPAEAGHRASVRIGRGAGHGRVSAPVPTHRRSAFHRPYRGHRYWGRSPYWSSWWWGGYWGPSVYVYRDGYRRHLDISRYAVVDTDISPETAEVWLDGHYIGSADDFDGFPDVLYLRPGAYKLEFRHPKYETLALDLDVKRGEKVDLNQELRLKPGRGRLDSFDPPGKGVPNGRVFGPKATPEAPDVEERSWSRDDEEDEDDEELSDAEEARPEREEAWDRDRERLRDRDRTDAGATADARPSERARLRWKVTPSDAAVYVDDRYLGTGEELSDARKGLPAEAGKRAITVLRPGYKTRTLEVEAKAGETVDVVIELEK